MTCSWCAGPKCRAGSGSASGFSARMPSMQASLLHAARRPAARKPAAGLPSAPAHAATAGVPRSRRAFQQASTRSRVGEWLDLYGDEAAPPQRPSPWSCTWWCGPRSGHLDPRSPHLRHHRRRDWRQPAVDAAQQRARPNSTLDRPRGRTPMPGALRYWLVSLAAAGSAGPSRSSPPWSSRSGGYRSVINATYTTSR